MTNENSEPGGSGAAPVRTPPPRSPRLHSLSRRLDSYSGWQVFAIVALPLCVIQFAMPSLWGLRSIDPFTNTLTAHTLATEQSVYLDDYEALTAETFRGRSAWVVWGDERPVSQYSPGAAFHAVVPYWLASGPTTVERFNSQDPEVASVDLEVPAAWPGDLVGGGTTAAAMGMLALAFRKLATGYWAVMAAYVACLGTSAVSVAGQALWQHGPAMMWIAVGTVALAYARPATAGVAYAVAVFTRPVTAAVAGVAMLWSAKAREWKAAAGLLLGAVAGLALVLLYNNIVFGDTSISGGYHPEVAGSVTRTSPVWYITNVALGLFHPRYGLLIWSPFLLILFVGVPAAWRAAPVWARGPALGAAAYLALSWLVNRSSGGSLYLFYRYPLEALVAAAPLLFVAYMVWVRKHPLALRVCHWAIVLSVTAHVLASLA